MKIINISKSTPKIFIAFLTVLFLMTLSILYTVCATELRFGWDANSESNLKGYRLYYGSVSGQYDQSIDVGNVTEYQMTVEDGITFFALKAYSGEPEQDSDFSDEVRVSLWPRAGDEFRSPFNSNSVDRYFVTYTQTTNGRNGQILYDSTNKRMQINTGDNIGISFARQMPVKQSGSFEFKFIPIEKFPSGGTLEIKLMQDKDNYILVSYSDGYPLRSLKVIRNSIVTKEIAVTANYEQGVVYIPKVSWKADRVQAEGIGDTIFLEGIAPINIKWFSIAISQQNGFIDDIAYLNLIPEPTPILKLEKPVKLEIYLDVYFGN
jgi:hypothetical protein